MDTDELTRFFQGLLVGFVLVGVLEGSPGIIVNSLVGLAATFLPDVLEKRRDIYIGPLATGWILVAVSLHAFGTLGPYQTTWWWDHVTHMLSSSVVAGVGYVSVRSLQDYSDIHLPPKILWVFLLSFTMAFGVLWEVLEFFLGFLGQLTGAKVLTQYGVEDTMADLAFDTVGAVLVAVFGSGQLEEVRQSLVESAQEI